MFHLIDIFTNSGFTNYYPSKKKSYTNYLLTTFATSIAQVFYLLSQKNKTKKTDVQISLFSYIK